MNELLLNKKYVSLKLQWDVGYIVNYKTLRIAYNHPEHPKRADCKLQISAWDLKFTQSGSVRAERTGLVLCCCWALCRRLSLGKSQEQLISTPPSISKLPGTQGRPMGWHLWIFLCRFPGQHRTVACSYLSTRLHTLAGSLPVPREPRSSRHPRRRYFD